MIYYKFFIDSIKLFFKLKITGRWIKNNYNSYQGVIMKTLTINKMEVIEGGGPLGCAAAIAGGALLVGSFFINPIGDAALAYYLISATVGPSVAGIGIGESCS